MKVKAVRQGDVFIISDVTFPDDLTEAKDKVLAYGEATGHAHRLKEGNVKLYETELESFAVGDKDFSFDRDVTMKFLEVSSDTAILSHEEHNSVTLTKGKYGVIIQREYEPESWREVID